MHNLLHSAVEACACTWVVVRTNVHAGGAGGLHATQDVVAPQPLRLRGTCHMCQQCSGACCPPSSPAVSGARPYKAAPRSALRMGLPSKGRMAEDTMDLLKVGQMALDCSEDAVLWSILPCRPRWGQPPQVGGLAALALPRQQGAGLAGSQSRSNPVLVTCRAARKPQP